jgi:hypothetical protein
MTRAFECAIALLQDHSDRMTIQQQIECHIALMGEPELAPLGLIAIAAQVIGETQ